MTLLDRRTATLDWAYFQVELQGCFFDSFEYLVLMTFAIADSLFDHLADDLFGTCGHLGVHSGEVLHEACSKSGVMVAH